MKPEELRYTRSHEWAHLDTSGDAPIVTVGISAFAVEQLTDLVHIDLPEAGTQVTAGEPFGEVESVKAVSDVYSPVDGEVLEVNDSLSGNLETLSTDPFGAGWMLKVKIADENQVSSLLSHDEYEKQVVEPERE